ncbi:MAG TPA: hypothetical protein VFL95_07620, partial [Gemmatimonadales bacterium]|nr:hypothetical protein [Gemmatimonadales bacterium]
MLLIAACHPVGPAPVVEVLPPVSRPPVAAVPAPAADTNGEVVTRMRRIHFRLDPILALDIAELSGVMRPRHRGDAVNFDDPKSFVLHLAEAVVVVDTTGLARIMNRYAFPSDDPPLSNLHLAAHDSLLEVRGFLHHGVGIPFTIKATVAVTGGGLIRLHPVDVNVGALDVDWFMNLFGITLQQVVDAHKAVGLTIDGNDLVLDPTAPLPPPAIVGRLASVSVVEAGLKLRFLDSALLARISPLPRPPREVPNYMFFRHGLLHFGKLFMPSADMEVVDSAPAGAFDFYLNQYQRQLEAG